MPGMTRERRGAVEGMEYPELTRGPRLGIDAFRNFFSKSSVEALIFLNNLNLSNINAHEKTELAIKRIITNFTTKSARKKSFHKEKSELPPKPTTWVAISCSIEVNYF